MIIVTNVARRGTGHLIAAAEEVQIIAIVNNFKLIVIIVLSVGRVATGPTIAG